MALNVPAVMVTDSTPLALQSILSLLLAGEAVPLIVSVPSRSSVCDQASPALSEAGRVVPLKSLVCRSTCILLEDTVPALPPGGFKAVTLPLSQFQLP